ncbi:hypothetical protein QUF54_07215, partial [Candidatus Marithioploca araucensis]|nr:hypothetical protein [Candidatus Marithioploca araucensis]
IYWFPRAGVGTHSGRASVQSVWVTRRWRVVKAFPRQRVGTRKYQLHDLLVPTRRRGNPFWTRQRPVCVGNATLARRQGIPTPARGNE